MTVDIVDTHPQSPALLRSYVRDAKVMALEKTVALEEFSPLAHSLILHGLDTAKSYTPDVVKDTLVSTVEHLDSYVECCDDLLQNAIEQSEEIPEALAALKSKLNLEQLASILAEFKNNSQKEFMKYLPSAQLENLILRARVQEIVQEISRQPQLFTEKASDSLQNLKEKLDIDADGKVSVLDLAGNAYNVSAGVATYASSLLSTVVGPLPTQADVSSLVESILSSPNSKTIVDSVSGAVQSQWDRTQELRTLLQPLWSATQLLKDYVSMYATNVKDHFNPLTPYLIALIAETSVIDLPIELYRLTSSTAGFAFDEDSSKVAQETRALFWALIDISALLEAMKQSDKNMVEPAPIEGVDMENDADALKDGKWAQGFSEMDFS